MNEDQLQNVSVAFSKQAPHFDREDKANLILQHLRGQVRSHVLSFLQPKDSMLELSCGTGLDAEFFSSKCKSILATDVSEGMMSELRKKIADGRMSNVKCQMLSFDELNKLAGEKFTYVFSNFGGLNCTNNLQSVARNLESLLLPGSFIALVIMPPFCLMEFLSALNGNFHMAFRRWKKNGTPSYLEGTSFLTWYYSPSKVRRIFGRKFRVIKLEALGFLLPQPHQKKFAERHPLVFSVLKKTDDLLRKVFPFHNWGDHYIITLQYNNN